MGREEQIEEREVLSSIFPDEITDVSDTEYRIAIKLNPPDDDYGDDEAPEPPTVILHVRYPDAYPDEAPILDLSAPPNATHHPRFSVSGDKAQLLKGLQDTVQESLGMAMVFTLVTALTEQAEQLMTDRRDAAAHEQEEALLAAEREENKKFHGTMVTSETFLKWRDNFVREMEERRQQEEEERLAALKKAKVKEPVRLTGKQLWERGLAGKVEEEDDEDSIGVEHDGEPLADQVDKLKVTA
ncbi:RWD-domain-containing protein [Xylaria sp. CBS 124048]|nr:RWD-domain-containing protein [Xylaria sp. CBS 124048]